MDELISVIIPVYNVEFYLKRCLDSVINQSYKKMEIILVNDGSTDNSLNICEEYKKNDDRIIIYSQHNQGLSAARNSGIKISKGKYLAFIDSDDYINPEMIELLYESIKKSNSEIACCGKALEYNKNTVFVNNSTDFVNTSEQALERMLLMNEIDNSACDKLFLASLFNKIRFPEGRYYEDIATVYKTFMEANRISHIRYIGYNYVIRNNSISQEKFSRKQFDSLYFTNEMTREITKKYKSLECQAKSFYYLELMTTIRKMHRSSNFSDYKKEYKLVKREYKSKIFGILKNKYIIFYKKIMGILIFFGLHRTVEIIYGILTNKK